jgi:hypothetical protein
MSQSRADFGRRSTIMRDNFMAAESDFDAISHHELAQSIVEAPRQQVPPIMGLSHQRSHEIACGDDAEMQSSRHMGTDVMPLTVRAEAGCNTQRVMTSEKMIDTTV